MSLLGGLVSGFLGYKSDKKQNKLAKEQLKTDKALADRQIAISKYIEQYAKEAAGMNSAQTDIYGGKAWYNPVTKQYETSLAGAPKEIQAASDDEELRRALIDQKMRANGLQDFENMRGRSVNAADAAFNDINDFKRGVGRLDAGRIGSQIRGDRETQLNAGYDDAERAAQTLQLRTGSSAVGDALTNLARDRVRAHAAIGSPELEGIQFAEGINNQREGALYNKYKMFGDEGRGFYDAAFQPSTAGAEALARLGDVQKFDIGKLDLAMGGSGQAASTIGNAAAGLRQGFQLYNNSRVNAPGAKLVSGIDGLMDKLAAQMAGGGMKFGSMFGG